MKILSTCRTLFPQNTRRWQLPTGQRNFPLLRHRAAIKETARLTDERVQLDESMKDVLSHKLQMIAERIPKQPEIAITYFRSDEKKSGGAYVTAVGTVKKIDIYKRMIVMTDTTAIPIDEIIGIEGQVFETMCEG